MRKTEFERKTNETEVGIRLNIDGTGEAKVDTGIGFFDHMLEQLAKHGMFDLTLRAKGDLQVDGHHMVEDVGLGLGEAFRAALGEKRGINRYGFFMAPLDEALAQVVVDLSGRPWCEFDAEFTREKAGGMGTELVEDFFRAFASGSRAAINVKLLSGRNDHHKIEAVFKSFAKALRMACEPDLRRKDDVPSTKGTLEG